MVGIYSIVNTANGKRYIGQSRDIANRLSVHRFHMKTQTHNWAINEDIKTCGYDAFKFEVLVDLTQETKMITPFSQNCNVHDRIQSMLDYYEDQYINSFRTIYPYGYNLQTGGESGFTICEESRALSIGENNPNYGRVWSDETNRKRSESLMGRAPTMLGHQQTDDAKRRISEAMKRRQNGENNSMLGKHQSDYMKQRVSEANSKAVQCINTGQIFKNMNKASQWCHVNKAGICSCCKGKVQHAGRHPVTGEKLSWRYW